MRVRQRLPAQPSAHSSLIHLLEHFWSGYCGRLLGTWYCVPSARSTKVATQTFPRAHGGVRAAHCAHMRDNGSSVPGRGPESHEAVYTRGSD